LKKLIRNWFNPIKKRKKAIRSLTGKNLAPKLAEQKAIVSQTEKQIAELEKEISENEQTIAKL
jgi:hypothetical protein